MQVVAVDAVAVAAAVAAVHAVKPVNPADAIRGAHVAIVVVAEASLGYDAQTMVSTDVSPVFRRRACDAGRT